MAVATREQLKQYCLRALGTVENIDDFIDRLQINKYTNWYFNIIKNALDRNYDKSSGIYVEGHHIIPVSLSGRLRKEGTKVFLTAREHFICHQLLVRMLSDSDKIKMKFALGRMMDGNAKNYCKSSKVYQSVKQMCKEASSVRSLKYWSEIPFEIRSQMRTGKNNNRYGVPVSPVTRNKISKSNKGKLSGDKHPFWGKPRSEETKKKISEQARKNKKNAGTNNPNYGKIGAATGKTWYHNPTTGETRYFVLGSEPVGFIKGRK